MRLAEVKYKFCEYRQILSFSSSFYLSILSFPPFSFPLSLVVSHFDSISFCLSFLNCFSNVFILFFRSLSLIISLSLSFSSCPLLILFFLTIFLSHVFFLLFHFFFLSFLSLSSSTSLSLSISFSILLPLFLPTFLSISLLPLFLPPFFNFFLHFRSVSLFLSLSPSSTSTISLLFARSLPFSISPPKSDIPHPQHHVVTGYHNAMHLAGATRQMTFLEAVANAVADADAITVAPGQWQAACSMQHAAPCPPVRSLLSAPCCPLCVVVASANVAIALANVAKKQLAKFSTDRQ